MLLGFVSPQILKAIINFVGGSTQGENGSRDPLWRGIFFAVLLFLTAIVQTLLMGQYFKRVFVVGVRVRTALVGAIYKKALRLSNAARKESTVGEIVNLMAVDAQRFLELTSYINALWSAPLQIILALYFLYDMLGPAVFAGLGVMIILMPISGFIANKNKTLQIRQMKNKDERIKLMNEILSGIKVLKLYAWEPSFEEQVQKIRAREISVLKKATYLNAVSLFVWSCAPFMVWTTSFQFYYHMYPYHYILSTSNTMIPSFYDLGRVVVIYLLHFH